MSRPVVNQEEFFTSAIKTSIQAFECDGLIVIPVWINAEHSPAGVNVPILHGCLTPDTVDNILLEAGKVARKNIRQRAKAERINPSTDLTPTFDPTTHPSA